MSPREIDGAAPGPGDQLSGASSIGPEPLVGTGAPSPLDPEDQGAIPAACVLVMKDRRHTQWGGLLGEEPADDLRLVLGSGDATLFALGDGRSHAMVSRLVGSSASCTYVLVGRVRLSDLDEVVAGSIPTSEVVSRLDELSLVGCAVVSEVSSSSIFLVETYRGEDDVPLSYRVGAAPLALDEDLEITAY